jgi:hypothetical protein
MDQSGSVYVLFRRAEPGDRKNEGYWVKCFISGVPEETPLATIERVLRRHNYPIERIDQFGVRHRLYEICEIRKAPSAVQKAWKRTYKDEDTSPQFLDWSVLNSGGRTATTFRTSVALLEAMERTAREKGLSLNRWMEQVLANAVALEGKEK